MTEHWDLKTSIDYLQRKVILNSIAYYELDRSPLSDKAYDAMCKELVQLHNEYGDISDTQYGYVMYDFDGTTGFDLYYRLTEKDRRYLMKIARAGLCL